jgi:hypothetical protein
MGDSLKLDTIDNGYDSLQVRIWTNVNHVQKVLAIKNSKGDWSASFIRFSPVLDKYGDSVVGCFANKGTVTEGRKLNFLRSIPGRLRILHMMK